MSTGKISLVIFDCDGVLIDSEGLSREVVTEEATRLGWALDEAGAAWPAALAEDFVAG